MDIAISLIIGICLAAACGFRVFVPLLISGIASQAGYLELSSSYLWIESVPAIIAFSVATLFEILGYYIPWVDNMLDTIATPLAPIAGVIASVSLITDADPLFKWTFAVIMGGGTAITVQLLSVKARAVSSFFTSGLGNFIVSTGELILSFLVSIMAVLIPVVTFAFLVIFLIFLYIRVTREKKIQDKNTGIPES